jgi:hypothetical protein
MSLATLLDQNKAFAATDAGARNPQIPSPPPSAPTSAPCSAPQLSPNIMVSGYVYNTAAGTLDTIVAPTPVGQH